jgi:molybdopterin-guanine dinucleotide biosynthesis protein A
VNAFLGAIVLAGGRAARLGGTAKPQLTLAGATLLDRTIDAAGAVGAASVVVVGPAPENARPDVRWVREDPPFSGPAAAVVAALAASDPADDPEWTLVLASDLVFPDAAAPRLVRDAALLPGDTEGLCLGDESSRPQWLTGVYRTAALRRAAATAADWRDAPMRALLDDLAIAVVRAPDGVVRDIDTWQDLDDARHLRADADAGTAKEKNP